MDDHVNFSDAVVALRSFGRRYSLVLSGPQGDDAWDRVVRTPGAAGASALDLAATTTAAFEDLTHTLGALAHKATLTASTPAVASVGSTTTVAAVLASLNRAAAAAANALAERRSDDEDRAITVDGHASTVGHYVSTSIQRAAHRLREIESAVGAPE